MREGFSAFAWPTSSAAMRNEKASRRIPEFRNVLNGDHQRFFPLHRRR